MVDFAKRLAESLERQQQYQAQNRGKQFTTQVSISIAGPDYAIKFDWDERLLKALKDAIPGSERTWHTGRKVWLVSSEFIDKAIGALRPHISSIPTLPIEKPSIPEVIEKTFLLEYLGATKDRGKRASAYGFVNDAWSVEITEEVLRGFFEGREVNTKPDGLQTLYQVLCVFEKATSEEISKAYKRLARQWHPDVCREENAHEMFIKLNEAYKVLINPEMKRRYDAGLYFERQGRNQETQGQYECRAVPIRGGIRLQYGYRSPLRCGQITARGTVRLMRFTVSEILKWDDVIDAQGRVMVSSWPKGSDHFVTEWLNQSPF